MIAPSKTKPKMGTGTAEKPTDPAIGSRRLEVFLFAAIVAMSLPRFILGPYSVVGVLGDIGDYSVPYLTAAAHSGFASNWVDEIPMGSALYESGFFAPSQFLLFAVLPGWLAHGLNWMAMTLVAGFSVFHLARDHFELPAYAAAFSASLCAVAVANGNFGYSVLAFMPLVLLFTFRFCYEHTRRRAGGIILSALVLAAWVPAKFLMIFPAIVVFVATVTLARGSVWIRLFAATIAIGTIYLLRTPDLIALLKATGDSERHIAVVAQPLSELLIRGLEYGLEYSDPRLIFEVRPLPQSNPAAIAFAAVAVAFLFLRRNPSFQRLAIFLSVVRFVLATGRLLPPQAVASGNPATIHRRGLRCVGRDEPCHASVERLEKQKEFRCCVLFTCGACSDRRAFTEFGVCA